MRQAQQSPRQEPQQISKMDWFTAPVPEYLAVSTIQPLCISLLAWDSRMLSPTRDVGPAVPEYLAVSTIQPLCISLLAWDSRMLSPTMDVPPFTPDMG